VKSACASELNVITENIRRKIDLVLVFIVFSNYSTDNKYRFFRISNNSIILRHQSILRINTKDV